MKRHLMRSAALAVVIPALLSACSLTENHMKMDRDTNQEFQDMRDALAPREQPAADAAKVSSADIPGFTDYTATSAADLKSSPLVTISVNETVPLKDVLYELAKQADYDVELDPRIRGAIIFTARNRPFDEVMTRIADLAGLRYKFERSVVRVELDSPYSKTYKVDYLGMTRSVTSSINSNGTYSGDSEGGASTSSGSSFSLSGKSDIDFWKDLDTNLKQILDSNSAKNALLTSKTPTIVAPTPVAPTPAPAGGASAGDDGAATAVTTPTVPTNVTAAPVPTSASSEDDEKSNLVEFTPTYSINKQAGLISVFANEKVHKKIQDYLGDLKRSVGLQVQIEAKVLEVSLTDEFAMGIQWDKIGSGPSFNFSSSFTPGAFESGGIAEASKAVLGFSSKSLSLDGLVSMMGKFGGVHALASPRLTVLNNQSAVLNVATNQTYFEITAGDKTTNSNSTTASEPEAQPKTVSEGVLVNVTPSIDQETGEITMTVRPTVTRIVGYTQDPITPANRIPNLSVQEFDSVVKVKSGDVVVMGGLIRDRVNNERSGIPVLSEAPLIGSLFRGQQDSIGKSELVVFLRATVVDSARNTIHQTDKDMYRLFSQDRRPFPM